MGKKIKKHKVFTTSFIALFLIIMVVFTTFFVTKIILTKNAVDYLEKKYNMDESQIEIIDYESGRFHVVSTDWIFEPFKIEWHDYKWEFNYNGRSFFINRINGKYYDDYQLDDVQYWAMDWFAENINKHIIGVQFDSSNIINYQLNYGNKSTILEKNFVKLFDESYTHNDYNEKFIDFKMALYIEESYYDTLTEQEKDEIINSIKYKLPNSNFEILKKSQKNKVEKQAFKYSIWIFSY